MKRIIFLFLALFLSGKAYAFFPDDIYESPNRGGKSSAGVAASSVAYIQSTFQFASGLSNVKAFDFNNTAGCTILLGVAGGYHNPVSVASVADTKLNTYTVAVSSMFVGASATDANFGNIYYAKNIPAGANTITVTLNVGSDASTIFLNEYCGLNASNPFVVASSGTGRGGPSPTTGSMATTGDGQLVVGLLTDSASGTPTITPGSGFKLRQKLENGSQLVGAWMDRGAETALANGSYVANCTRSNENPDWEMTGAIFKP